MFKINKSLRRLGIVSVSALMLLGVGASAMGSANTPVHAESNAEIAESLKRHHVGVMTIDKLTPEQKKDEAQATAWANKVDMNEDIKAHESEGMTRSQAIASIKKFNKEKQDNGTKEANKLAKEQQKRIKGKSTKQLAKEQKMAMVQGNQKPSNPVKIKKVTKHNHRIASEITKLQKRLNTIGRQIHHLV